MGGFFGVVSKRNAISDVFFGTDYHSHLGTRRAGMAVYSKEKGYDRAIHNIENSPFRTKFDKDVNEMSGNLGIGCISDYEPQPLIVRSHHGTSVTRYFYNTAVNTAIAEGKNVEDIRKEDYTYPGPKPSTKEAAILMMADAIEARSRSLSSLTEQSITEMVDQMIDSQVADGQFSDTALSFKDLEDIRAVFKQKLLEMNHHRITYPTIEEK